MPVKKTYDKWILISVLGLLTIGVIMIYSSSAPIAAEKYNDHYYFLKKQLFWSFLGLIAMFITSRIDYGYLKNLTVPLTIITIILLILLFVPGVGKEVGGATRWLRFWGVSFQPSELAKISIILYLSQSLVKKEEKLTDFISGYLPHLIILGIFFLLILLQPDLGTAVLIVTISFLLFFISGIRPFFIISSILMVLPFLIVAIFKVDFRKKRILAFLDPWSDYSNAGFQIVQSFFSFGRGGIFGAGVGNGKQKFFYLPEPHTDFIFSVIGEELGFLGVIFVISLFCILIFRGILIALRCSDLFGKYIAFGLIFIIGIQIVVNIGVVIGLLPTKGITLPLMSAGGSSLLITLISIGILLNISEHTVKGA